MPPAARLLEVPAAPVQLTLRGKLREACVRVENGERNPAWVDTSVGAEGEQFNWCPRDGLITGLRRVSASPLLVKVNLCEMLVPGGLGVSEVEEQRRTTQLTNELLIRGSGLLDAAYRMLRLARAAGLRVVFYGRDHYSVMALEEAAIVTEGVQGKHWTSLMDADDVCEGGHVAADLVRFADASETLKAVFVNADQFAPPALPATPLDLSAADAVVFLDCLHVVSLDGAVDDCAVDLIAERHGWRDGVNVTVLRYPLPMVQIDRQIPEWEDVDEDGCCGERGVPTERLREALFRGARRRPRLPVIPTPRLFSAEEVILMLTAPFDADDEFGVDDDHTIFTGPPVPLDPRAAAPVAAAGAALVAAAFGFVARLGAEPAAVSAVALAARAAVFAAIESVELKKAARAAAARRALLAAVSREEAARAAEVRPAGAAEVTPVRSVDAGPPRPRKLVPVAPALLSAPDWPPIPQLAEAASPGVGQAQPAPRQPPASIPAAPRDQGPAAPPVPPPSAKPPPHLPAAEPQPPRWEPSPEVAPRRVPPRDRRQGGIFARIPTGRQMVISPTRRERPPSPERNKLYVGPPQRKRDLEARGAPAAAAAAAASPPPKRHRAPAPAPGSRSGQSRSGSARSATGGSGSAMSRVMDWGASVHRRHNDIGKSHLTWRNGPCQQAARTV
eukprot:TRINITY_DN16559_c0_g6_i1.p1 TRINITY_DN16559_c0_g6~~TRINITY_DN16559_c0_g6_i1.p1  ORF type:complete len:674 (+),score=147.46 TRINITY_DN16559_c0_g6_i1:100-2121(+)